MKKNIFKIGFAMLAVMFVSCDDDFDNPVEDIVVSSGNADFSRYVSVGNSLTAGYADNALYASGQNNSYPNILAGQFALAGGGAFTQPLMPDDIGGFSNLGVAGKLQLQIVNGSLSPVATASVAPYANISSGGPYNNVGIPGIKSYHIAVSGYGNAAGIALGTANPYFARMISDPSQTVLAYAAAQNPTFFTLWLGNNDVLSYALSGGTGTDQTGNVNPATYGANDITDPNVLKASINAALSALTANGAKGAVANIPNVKDIPYFTTVPYNPLTSSNSSYTSMVPTLNQSFGALNAVYDYLGHAERKIVFSATEATPVVIKDEDLTDLSAQITAVLVSQGLPASQAAFYGQTYGQTRQAKSTDLLLLTTSSVIGTVDTARVATLMALGYPQATAAQFSIVGITYPMEDKWVLTPTEQTHITTAVSAFNSSISELAASYDLALVDVNAQMNKLSNSGLRFYGNTITTTFVSGGAFSLDGVHLTPIGYAIVANMYIDSINTKYRSTLTHVTPINYPGVTFP